MLQGDVYNNLKAYLAKWKSGELDRECIKKGVC
jgi:hypothetical protein